MDIFTKIKLLEFPQGEYVVVASGTLEALGIRKANDIDIAVTPKLHLQLMKTGKWKEEIKYEKVFLQKEGIEIISILDWDKFHITTEEAINSALVINGISFMNLNHLRQFKQALGREKDFKDIELINKYEQS